MRLQRGPDPVANDALGTSCIDGSAPTGGSSGDGGQAGVGGVMVAPVAWLKSQLIMTKMVSRMLQIQTHVFLMRPNSGDFTR